MQRIEKIDKHLSFVTLSPFAGEGWVETRVPVYFEIGQEYIGKPVDVITERKGFLGRRFEQTVEASNISNSTVMDYSLIRKINDAYRQLDRQSTS